MQLDSGKIRKIYNGKVASQYDLPISHMFKAYKKKDFSYSTLKSGDNVLVFCCGTGLDFIHIIRKIGNNGKITGVDFSGKMLEKAKERCDKNKWRNIDLVEADVTGLINLGNQKFDVGICTLGLSIIPDYEKAYRNLLNHVKDGGEIMIGDMQLANDWYSRFNPFTIFLAKRFGGSFEGHKNSEEIKSIMSKTLKSVKMKELFLNSYFYCIGIK